MDTTRTYGWKPDLPDHRDYRLPKPSFAALPSSVDLRNMLPIPYDQGDLGSCTANAIAAALEYDLKKQGLVDFMPSRLFIYYNERALEGTIKEDAGAMIRDGMKVVAKYGACREVFWPYNIAKFKNKPVKKCYLDGLKHRAKEYLSINQTEHDLKACLADGFPVVFGFTVYTSFESEQVARTGIVPMPGKNEQVLGGHAVLIVGYDDSKRMFLVRNSWGTEWGVNGHFWMPYDYVTNPQLCDDFWTIRTISG